MDIRIGVIGRIVFGEDKGRYVKVVDDAEHTGFLILTSDERSFITGFDDWVEDRPMLARYFQETGWQIEWLE
jgi:hypothetical protein